jgi:hypothetical protein
MGAIDTIENWSKLILFVMLPCLGFLGVVLHCWFSYRLSFFDFHGDKTSNKKSLKRIIIPWLIVGALSAIVPIVIDSSHAALHNSITEGEVSGIKLVEYIRFPWNYFLPVIAMEISIITCFIIGSLCYFIIGLLAYSISILIIQKRGT